MQTRAVIQIKLPENEAISRTFIEFNKGVQIAFKHRKIGGRKSIHDKCYRIIKRKTKLPSQLSCSAIRRVTQNRKADSIREISIRYDIRNFWFKDSVISLSTIDGRLKIPVVVPEYFRKYDEWKTSGCDIVKKGNVFYAHIFVARDIEPIESSHVVGIDVGINKLAVTSDCLFFKGIKNKIRRFESLRSRLQSKGTPSAKRHLKKLSGKEKLFRRDVNHVISKRIVESAEGTIVMEKLTHIRRGTIKKYMKRNNRRISGWAFRQLQTFIEYKAIQSGIKVAYVNPAFSSQTCSKCSSLDTIRNHGFFHCNTCYSSLDADLNASRNIANLYDTCDRAVVIQPIVAQTELQAHDL
jgi:IS605 OrfB family transposase